MKIIGIPLVSHEAIVAALIICDMVGNDNLAVVMVKGYGGDDENYTGVHLSDYELDEIIDDDGWFSDYTNHELWVTVPEGGAA